MNDKNLQHLVERAAEDEGLRARFESAGTPADVVALGASLGFTFSEEDLARMGGGLAPNSFALSDEELEQVAGGARFGLGGLGVIELTEVETCGTPCCTIEPAGRNGRLKLHPNGTGLPNL